MPARATSRRATRGSTRAELERSCADYLGVRKVLWLGRGIAGDDTHGHVDDLARFVDADDGGRWSQEADPADANYEPLQENLRRLRSMRDQDGQRAAGRPAADAGAVFFDGQRLPASYANFYIANAVVLVPTFNDPERSTRAAASWPSSFPTGAVVGIHAVDLVWGLGTLHCMTQQEPA